MKWFSKSKNIPKETEHKFDWHVYNQMWREWQDQTKDGAIEYEEKPWNKNN